MPAISRFTFDTVFTPTDPGPDGAWPAEPPPPVTYSEQQMQAARAAAYAEGHAAGHGEALAEREQFCAAAIAATSKHLAQALERARRDHATRLQEAVAIAADIARKLLPTLARKHALGEIEGFVANCIERLYDEPRIVVRVHPSVLDLVAKRLDGVAAATGFAGRFILLGADELPMTDARVEWADGGADRDGARLWKDIDEAIARFVAETPDDSNMQGSQGDDS